MWGQECHAGAHIWANQSQRPECGSPACPDASCTNPDKTFVGRVEREIDFLGYHFSPEELSVAATTLRQFERRVSRLYEQDSTGDRVRDYVKRFQQWVRSGLYDIDVSFAAPTDPSWMTNSTV